jgi:hypothetical protein
MKIGIITYWNVPNYGAMLQAHALCDYLINKGHEVYFIDCRYIYRREYPLWRILMSRSLLAVKLKVAFNYSRQEMCSFVVGLKRTRPYNSYKSLKQNPPDCDMYIVGSDQMWNPSWFAKELDTVLLNFGDKTTKRIAYAVSFGTNSWLAESERRFKELLNNFSKVSVREQSGVDLVYQITGRECHFLPDPTLLFDKSYYNKFHKTHQKNTYSYIFKYALNWNKSKVNAFSDYIADVIGCKNIITQHEKSNPVSLLQQFLKINKKIGVSEWLNRIANSCFVITDSFHGTIFSILNRKPFIVILINDEHNLSGMNERIISLLHFLGLENRMFEQLEPSKLRQVVNEPIDWNTVDSRIVLWRKETDSFFEDVLAK